MLVAVWDYQGKGRAYAEALQFDGRFELTGDVASAEIVLADSDHPLAPPVPEKHESLQAAVRRGARVVLYPHGGPPVLDYDGLRPAALPVTLQFVPGEGHAEIYRRIRHRFPVRVAGWALSGLAEPIGGTPIEHLVYAPLHPWADGKTILRQHFEANREAYQAFLAHPAPRKTVRLWGMQQAAGIAERDPSHTYVEGPPFTISPEQTITEANAVLSFGTFAYMAVALGKPTVMYGQDLCPCSDDGRFLARHWERYREFMRYPACLGDGLLDELFGRDVSEWRSLFVGGPFDARAVCDAVFALRPNRAERRRRTRARVR